MHIAANNAYHKTTLKPLPESASKVDHNPISSDTYEKICEHCHVVYNSQHAPSQHCLPCATCSKFKALSAMAGKAQYIGYICSDCYRVKPHVKKFAYTIRLLF